MRAGRRAFALILVLIAVASVFALAMRSAVVARTTVVEAEALALRQDALRGGRSAVVVALRGLTATGEDALVEAAARASGGTSAADGVAVVSGSEEEGETSPELPEFIKRLIPELQEAQDEAEKVVDERARRIARAASAEGVRTSGVSVRRTLDVLGLPSRPVEVTLEGRTYRVTLRDAAAALDANTTDERQLRAYFRALGLGDRMARGLADEWLDWTDEDSVARTYGAEQRAYASVGVFPRNGALLALEELLSLPSMTPEVFDRVRRDWSVSALSAVHAGSASFAVLASLEGASESWAREVIEAREEAPLTRERLEELLPAIGSDELKRRVTLSSSGVVRVGVEVLGASSGAVLVRLDGAAVLTERGIGAVELRVVE